MSVVPTLTRASALALAALLCLAACGESLTPAEHLVRAQSGMDKGDYRTAFIELSNAVEQDPKSMEARWLLAKTAMALGDGARAEKEARRALELGQSNTAVQPIVVRAIMLQGDVERVLKETAALDPAMPAPTRAMLLGMRAQALLLQGKLDEGGALLEQALQIDGRSVAALIGMSVLQVQRRDVDAARQWLARAIQAEPTSPESWSTLGDLELMQGNIPAAEAAFSKAVQYRSFPTLDQAKRALVLLQSDKIKEAEADLQALKERGYDKHPYVNYVRGLSLFRQKRYAEAAEAFGASKAANPDFMPNRMYLATTHYLLGHAEQALQHAERVQGEAPKSLSIKRLLGAIQISREEYDAAKKVLQAALAESPDDPNLLNMMATLAMLEGNPGKGLEYTNRIALLTPQSKAAQDRVLMAKFLSGQGIGDPSREVAGDAYTGEMLRALGLFRDQRPDEALALAAKLHQRDPQKVDPLNLMAACYLITGKIEQGAAQLEKVLKLQPAEPSASYNLAKIETGKGNHTRARALLRPLVEARPGDEHAVLLLAEVEERLGDLAAGRALLEQALQRNALASNARAALAGGHLRAGQLQKVLELTQSLSAAQLKRRPDLLELRGKAQMRLGDVGGARQTFEQWVRLAPKSAAAHLYLGDSEAMAGDVHAARASLGRALQLNPGYLPARIGEIKMLVRDGKVKEARQALPRLRKDFGERVEVLDLEGWFALGSGDYATAVQRLTAATKRRPDTETTVLLARAWWLSKQPGKALQVLQDWVKRRPEDVGAWLELAEGYLALGKEGDARTTYQQVLKRNPGALPALNNLAWLNREKDLYGALEYAQQAYKLAPRDPLVLDTYGTLLLLKGEKQRGRAMIQEAAQRAPGDAKIQLHLARLYADQGESAKARQVLQAIVKQAPGSATAKEAQAMLANQASAR